MKRQLEPKSYKAIVGALRPYRPQKIVLFGSRARGDADVESDLDLIIIKETPARFLDRLGEVYDLLAGFGNIDILVYTPQEVTDMLARGNAFLEDALAEGITLYEERRTD
jgi:predicted nucleotidyltransferase